MPQDIWSTLFYVIVMVGVLLAAYYTTKFLSGRAGRTMKSRYIRIVDSVSVGRDKMLVVAKVGKKNLLLGITNQTISTLGEIEGIPEDEEEGRPSSGGVMSKFAAFLAHAKSAPENLQKARREARESKNGTAADEKPLEQDDDLLDQLNRAIEKQKGRSFRSHNDNGGQE